MTLTGKQREELRHLFSGEAGNGGRVPVVVLISCSKSKAEEAAPAAELYRSNTFRKSLDLARRIGATHYILSARYGVVTPECILPPYNVSIHDLSEAQRRTWAADVAVVLKRLLPKNRDIWFFSSKHYSEPLIPLIQPTGRSVHYPLAGMPIGKMNGWLSIGQRFLDRRESLALLYREFEALAEKQGRLTLREVIQQASLPQQGLYFFFDPEEQTRFSQVLPRLVRVGTHAISKGSKAILRTRLRTHLGTESGNGNHRASVFRLHVGAALIARGCASASAIDPATARSAPIRALLLTHDALH
jgi:hypothetical protein